MAAKLSGLGGGGNPPARLAWRCRLFSGARTPAIPCGAYHSALSGPWVKGRAAIRASRSSDRWICSHHDARCVCARMARGVTLVPPPCASVCPLLSVLSRQQEAMSQRGLGVLDTRGVARVFCETCARPSFVWLFMWCWWVSQKTRDTTFV